MKKLLLTAILIFTTSIYAQEAIDVKNLNGTTFDLDELILGEEHQPVIFVTWAKKWCWPCVKMLDELNDSFIEFQEDYNLKIVALNLDSEYSRQEIKDFVYERGWDFDVYVDHDSNYMTITETTAAPLTTLVLDGDFITTFNGFIDGVAEPESTADYFLEVVNDLYGNVIYYDEDWDNTTKEFATYVRYRDKIDGKYLVTDRWVTGEIQMTGAYNDYWCTDRTGEFRYYDKDGSLSSSETY